ncbi:TnsD family Tn7-like transposition protein [Fischerella sp. PCC 9605]
MLKSLQCSLEISQPHHCWLFKLLRPQSSCHPLHHLLFIQFWG